MGILVGIVMFAKYPHILNGTNMKRISLIMFAICLAALSLAFLSSCRAAECQKMARCCAAIQDHDGVGSACGEIAAGVKDPDSCRTIVRSVEAMFEERDETLPESCR
jgi:hypothetical protein